MKSNALTSETCRELIEKFEKSDRKRPGVIGERELQRVNEKVKKSTDLNIFQIREFDSIKLKIFEKMPFMIEDYLEYITERMGFKKLPNVSLFNETTTPWCSIQRTDKDGHFVWHSDISFESRRLITFIFYLNTLDENDGGKTEFYDGTKITPEEGKLIMFPSDWMHIHRGCKVTSDKSKYIMTGFICQR